MAAELRKIKELIDMLRAKKWPDVDFARASIEQISQMTGRAFNIP